MKNYLRESLSPKSDIDMVREDIIGELEAINLYQLHINRAQSPKVQALLSDIRDEEKVHVGELFALLFELDPSSASSFKDGHSEALSFINESRDPDVEKTVKEIYAPWATHFSSWKSRFCKVPSMCTKLLSKPSVGSDDWKICPEYVYVNNAIKALKDLVAEWDLVIPSIVSRLSAAGWSDTSIEVYIRTALDKSVVRRLRSLSGYPTDTKDGLQRIQSLYGGIFG